MKTIVLSLVFLFAFSGVAGRKITFWETNNPSVIALSITVTSEDNFVIAQDGERYTCKLSALPIGRIEQCSNQKWSYVKFNKGEAVFEQRFNFPLTLYVTHGEASVKQGNESSKKLTVGEFIQVVPNEALSITSTSKILRFFIHNSSK